MSTTDATTEKRIDTQAVTGPHVGLDPDGHRDHEYYRCTQCGLETTDEALAEQGCFRCQN